MTRLRTAELVHLGGGSFQTLTGTGREVVFGDRIEAGELSPVESLVAALAACSAMDVVPILAKMRQEIATYRISISAEQRDEYPQILTSVDVLHDVEGPSLTEAAVRRAVELSARKYCPVSATVAAGDTVVTHRYRMRCTGPLPAAGEGVAAVTGPNQPQTIVDKVPLTAV